MRIFARHFGAALASALTLVFALNAQLHASDDFVVRRVATGLSRPVFLTAPPGDAERVFIVEQHSGRIKILDLATGQVLPTPFLTISPVSTGNEQGLLGLAFHPDYARNGLFYVNFTDPETRVLRYRVSADPNVADPASAIPILSINQPFSNHNAGWMGFGPDRMLYIATGDGGSRNDPLDHGQTITNNLLGKILRIDVDGDSFPADAERNYAIPSDNPFVGISGDDEIFVYGLRNPWRCSFDRMAGDLYCGDVGQGSREEIDFVRAASKGGQNFGWRLREGTIQNPASVGGPRPERNVDPIHDYPRSSGYSVTGGYVYRGPAQSIRGQYFFADYGSGRIWSLRHNGVAATAVIEWTGVLAPDSGTLRNISSFGEDAIGNLYLVTLSGSIYRFDALATAAMEPVPVPLPWYAGAVLGALVLLIARTRVKTRR